MPATTTPTSPTPPPLQTLRKRRISSSSSSALSKARARLRGVVRDDSDDELGSEDLPWEWVYSPSTGTGRDGKEKEGKERKDKEGKATERKIVGARMGSFDVHIGDCLLIKGEGLKGEAYVGMACEFAEGSGGKEGGVGVCNVNWFSTESEIRRGAKKRTDSLPNELYLNPSYDEVPLPSINGRAIVLSPAEFNKQYPDGVSKKSKEFGKVFVCRRACNPRTATYSDEFVWEDLYRGRDTDIFAIGDYVRRNTKATRKALANVHNGSRAKRRRVKGDSVSDDDERDPEDDEDDEYTKAPATPSRRKRQKAPAAGTPTRRTPAKFTTPTHKRVTIKKPLLFTPLSTRTLSAATHLSTPYAIARHRLHVSTLPASLPCREEEFTEVYTHLSAAITEGTGSCIYISGTPGTGKTATVREVVSQLQALVAAEELDDFTFVEINGMKVTDPHQSYSLLWEAIKGERVSPSQALGLLEAEFSTPSPRRVPCVVLMDELDQLVTRGQGVMYNFFNWPGGRYSRLIVLAVANTMDLPERTLSNKISSRLGLTRITFPGYTHSQLQTIIASRLEGVPGNIVDADAIQFASRKVAAVSGDARRALDICRRAVEIVEYADSTHPDATAPGTPSRRESIGGGGGLKAGGRVTIPVIKKAIQESTSSPLQTFLKLLPCASKVFLAALLTRVRRSGVAENLLADVFEEAERMAVLADDVVKEVVAGGARRAGLAATVAALVDAGIVSVEGRKGERGGRVRCLVGEEEVKMALRGDKEVGGMMGV
ncbi:P-loop containing nucleoside triphosphate hydrolase protein [Tricharina praecox]|uniref:P-loop containing nucleoside triphosphate hydrolase protein n=1 Tax=Tricharina praecox TaxID=43433 RepID=UPI002220FC71|nr:P-loop containing nucleoside triphosphate hydrolase protein [Tricharina praecox]KAI5855626.1 P-loop containing nucleoside triphosphate hydrolase protein [Tricharina praecox]